LLFAGGRLYNAKGERFMKKYYPQTLEQSSRAQINKAVGLEIREGRGTPEGCVYLDASSLAEGFMKDKIISVFNLHASRGIDLTWQPMRLCSSVHTFLGGVGIDEKGRTTLSSLYAAGEVSGGFNGASRLGGNALTNAMGMGSVAGREAAAECKHEKRKPVSEEQVSEEFSRLKELLSRSSGAEEAKARDELRRAMWKNVGVTRDGGELSSNLDSLGKIKTEILPRVSLPGKTPPAELRKVLELENMCLMGEMITRAALMRGESRGAHTRIDYPETRPEWLKNIIIMADGEKMKLFTRSVVELPRK
jgi:succinate dehydrogenase/fumarate reductase flavoprotein subunit